MTVLTADHKILGTGRPLLPRVNLLPPEIAQKRAFRRIQVGMGAAVVASLAVVGGLYVSAAHGVTAAQSDIEAARSQQAVLNQQIHTYAGVTAVYSAAEQARAQLSTAMGDEIRYSQLLNDLSLAIPSNIWLSSLSFTQVAPGAAPADPNAPAPLGTASFQGVGFSHDDVASWLDALGKLKTYTNPYFTNSLETTIGVRPAVNFSSTVELTPAAQSHRYKPAGG